MKKQKESPLARITWVCVRCDKEDFSYGLYDEKLLQSQKDSTYRPTHYCSSCATLTPHTYILPLDDDRKHYKRPTLF